VRDEKEFLLARDRERGRDSENQTRGDREIGAHGKGLVRQLGEA